jgi:hypothetical protein
MGWPWPAWKPGDAQQGMWPYIHMRCNDATKAATRVQKVHVVAVLNKGVMVAYVLVVKV